MKRTSNPAVETLMTQGYEQLTTGRFEEAVDTFSATLAIEPAEARVLRGRGLAYLQLKQWAMAAGDFRAARDLAPHDPDNWVDLGVSLAMDNQIYQALEVFDTLLVRHPSCVRGHIEVGLLHIRLGAIPKGRAHLQIALTRHPTLEQRRLIESVLREQEKLDRKRLYRPDFEALRRHSRPVTFGTRITQVFRALKQKFGGTAP